MKKEVEVRNFNQSGTMKEYIANNYTEKIISMYFILISNKREKAASTKFQQQFQNEKLSKIKYSKHVQMNKMKKLIFQNFDQFFLN